MEQNKFQDLGALDVVDIRHLFSLLRRNFWLLLLGLLLGGGSAFIVSRYQTPIYQAKTQVMVTRSSSTGGVSDVTQALNAQQLAETYVELLTQDWVLDDVAARVGSAVNGSQVEVSAATNTLVINIVTEDPDPNRAATIADMLVQVLISQNEAIQSGRYTEAEQGLNLQIQQIQAQIAETQTQLNLARTGALDEKLVQMQGKIESTQVNIESTQAEIAKLKGLTLKQAEGLLRADQNHYNQLQEQLEIQLTEYQALDAKLANDFQAQADPQYATLLQAQMAEIGVAINATREEIASLENDITWLTPLIQPGALEKALAEKIEYRTLQETLLASYQQTYTNLLAGGNIPVDTDEVARLEKDLNLYQQIYINLVNNREIVRLQKMQNMPNVIQVNRAVAGAIPIRPRITLNSILGAIAGLILAITVVLTYDFLDTTLRTREDIERALNLPVMGYMLQFEKEEAQKEGPYVLHVPRSPATEAFRSLRTNLEFIGIDKPLKSILISSSGSSEGKTTLAANLAAVMAQGGKRVVLVDADLRRPRLHREMGLVNRLGLSDVFRDKVSLKDVIRIWDDLPNLAVITSGGLPPNPAELLGSEKMNRILSQLESEFDMVIIDSTPTLVTDSQLIAARSGGVLMVIWPGRTHADAARATVEQYRHVGARLLGVVLNNIQPGQGYGGYTPYTKNYQYYQYDRSPATGWLKLPWRKKGTSSQPSNEKS